MTAGLRTPARELHAESTMARVLLVGADPVMRQLMAGRLHAFGVERVDEAASLAEARTRARASGRGDLAIVHLELPDGSGLGLIAELRVAGWPRLVTLTSSADLPSVGRVLQAGVRGCLIDGARSAAEAQDPFLTWEAGSRDGSAVARPSRGNEVLDTSDRPQTLSSRELEVLQLIADGRSNKSIGEALNLSALTVKSHLSRIGRKLGTGDRAQVVLLALRAGAIR